MLAAPAAMAQNYAENLVVTINGESTDPVPASIDVQKKENGTCTFMLKNFMLIAGESVMPVGTIELEGVTMTEADGQTTLETTQTINIQAGDDATVAEDGWLGPMLGDVPIVLSGKIVDGHLLANIDIDMSATLEQIINVKVGVNEVRNYTEPLVVTINEESTEPQDVPVQVMTLVDGSCIFRLNNFKLTAGESSIPVGNIVVADVNVENKGQYDAISTKQDILITAGTDESVPAEGWLGPMLGEVPLVLNGKMMADKLFVNIDIDMSATLEQIINVKLGTDEGFPEIPEGIEHIDAAQGNATVIYDLNGIRQMLPLSRLAKGVYVVNGRKVVK